MKVDVIGETVKCSINGQEVLSASNYSRKGSYVGLMSWNANVEFRNTVFKIVDTSNSYQMKSHEALKSNRQSL